jgi:hypothetical protein
VGDDAKLITQSDRNLRVQNVIRHVVDQLEPLCHDRTPLLTAVRSATLIATLATDGFDDAFPPGFLDGRRDFFDFLLRDDAVARRDHDLFITLSVNAGRICHQTLFALAGSRQADLFTFDHVFGFGHFLLIGHDLAGPRQIAAAATGARMKQRPTSTLRRHRHSQQQRD